MQNFMIKILQILIATVFSLLLMVGVIFGVAQAQNGFLDYSVDDFAPNLPTVSSPVRIQDTTAPQMSPPPVFDITVQPYVPIVSLPLVLTQPTSQKPVASIVVAAPSKGKESNAFEFKVVSSDATLALPLLPGLPLTFGVGLDLGLPVLYSGPSVGTVFFTPKAPTTPLMPVLEDGTSAFYAVDKEGKPLVPAVIPVKKITYQIVHSSCSDQLEREVQSQLKDLESQLHLGEYPDALTLPVVIDVRGEIMDMGEAVADFISFALVEKDERRIEDRRLIIISQLNRLRIFGGVIKVDGKDYFCPKFGEQVAPSGPSAGLVMLTPGSPVSLVVAPATKEALTVLAKDEFIKQDKAAVIEIQRIYGLISAIINRLAGVGTADANSLNGSIWRFDNEIKQRSSALYDDIHNRVDSATRALWLLTDKDFAQSISYIRQKADKQTADNDKILDSVVYNERGALAGGVIEGGRTAPDLRQNIREVVKQVNLLVSILGADRLDMSSDLSALGRLLDELEIAIARKIKAIDDFRNRLGVVEPFLIGGATAPAVSGGVGGFGVGLPITEPQAGSAVGSPVGAGISLMPVTGGAPVISAVSAPAPIITSVVSVAAAVRSYISRVRILFGVLPQTQQVVVPTAPIAPKELAVPLDFAANIASVFSGIENETKAMGQIVYQDVIGSLNKEGVVPRVVFAPFFAKPVAGGGVMFNLDPQTIQKEIDALQQEIDQVKRGIINSPKDFDKTEANKALADLEAALVAKKVAKDLLDKVRSGELSRIDVCMAIRSFIAGQILPKLRRELAGVKDDDKDALGKRILLDGLIKGLESYRSVDSCKNASNKPTSLVNILKELAGLWGNKAEDALRDRGLFDLFGSLDALISEFSIDWGLGLPEVIKSIKSAGADNEAAKTAAQQVVNKVAKHAPLLVPPVDKSIELLQKKAIDFWGCTEKETTLGKLLQSFGLIKPPEQKDFEVAMRAVVYDSVRKIMTEQLAELIGQFQNGGGAPTSGTKPFSVVDAQDLESASNGDVNALGRLATRAASGQNGDNKAKAVVKVRVMVEFLKNLKGYKYSCGVKSNLAEAFKAAVDAVNSNPTEGLDFMLEFINVKAISVKLFGISELKLAGDTEVFKTFNAMGAIDHMVDTVEGKGLDAVRNVKAALDAMEQKQTQAGK